MPFSVRYLWKGGIIHIVNEKRDREHSVRWRKKNGNTLDIYV